MGLHALVLVSDVSASALLEQTLRRRGHDVTVCTVLEEAVATYKPDLHALVVADGPPDSTSASPLGPLRECLDDHQSLLVAVMPPDAPGAFQAALDAGADEVLDATDETALDGRLALTERCLSRMALRTAKHLNEHRQAQANRTAAAPELTEQQRTESALQASQARAQAILATTVDAVITINERGTIESFNQAATRTTVSMKSG